MNWEESARKFYWRNWSYVIDLKWGLKKEETPSVEDNHSSGNTSYKH
jgi:hypothetical protein